MKMRRFYMPVAAGALMVGFMGSCSNSEDPNAGFEELSEDIQLSARSRATADQLGEFYTVLTRDMGNYIDREGENGNFVISPLSASMVMAMMGNAVEGDLRQEILDYMGLEDLEGLNELSATLLNVLPGIDRKTRMTMANSVWVNNLYKLNSEFSGLMESSYMSEINYFNASDPSGTVKDINRWCASKTDNKIKGYMDEMNVDPYLMALLLNAMNFKSEWRIKDLFNESLTKPRPFYGENGENEVTTMRGQETGLYCYFEDGFTYVNVPFGNAAYKFEVVLPDEGKDVRDITHRLVGSLREINRMAREYSKVTLELPKFSLENKVGLNSALRAGGLKSLDKLNPLSLFTEEKTGLIQFNQSVMFEVDEKGAKAVAVSSGELLDSLPGPDPSEPVEIKVNRPFLFFITERSTGVCLVAGRVTDL